MIIGDESFYNMIGEEINRKTLVQQMIQYYNDKYPDSSITDFNEGSEIRNLLEAIAVDIYHLEKQTMESNRVAFLSTTYGQYLDLYGEELNTPRDYGSESWGVVTFTIPSPINYNVIIPYGTVLVSSTTGLQFITVNECEIPVGSTEVDCAVYSSVVGANNNAEPNTITMFRDNKPFSTLSVTNNESFTGGRDSETDDEYRNRLLSVKNNNSFGSKGYYVNLGTNIDGIHDILITTASNTNYTAKIIVNGDDKPLSNELFALVVATFTDENNIVFNHVFEVEKVGYSFVNLEVEITVPYEVTNTMIINALNTLFDGGNYGNNYYAGLDINESLSKYLIINCIESIHDDIQVTNLTSDNSNFSKLTPDDEEVLRLGTVFITPNVIR